MHAIAQAPGDDFARLLTEIGWSDAQIHEDMERAGYIPVEQHPPEVAIHASQVHGDGCFAEKDYRSGDRVCIVRFRDKKTIEGRFINHSGEPNVVFVVIGDESHAFASRNISAGEEVVVDYRQALALNSSAIEPSINAADADIEIRHLEAWLSVLPQQPEILNHDFTDGIYARQSIIDGGNLFTTETHKIDHPFALTEGEAFVWSKRTGWGLFKAPLIGVTRAGTRRVVLTKSRCVMTTFHPNPDNEKVLSKIWDRLYEKRVPPVNMTEGDLDKVREFMQKVGDAFAGIDSLPTLNERPLSINQPTDITS
jgi:hypothetical protein